MKAQASAGYVLAGILVSIVPVLVALGSGLDFGTSNLWWSIIFVIGMVPGVLMNIVIGVLSPTVCVGSNKHIHVWLFVCMYDEFMPIYANAST